MTKMTVQLLQMLNQESKNFPSFHLITGKESENSINSLEAKIGVILPIDYRDILLNVGAGTLDGEESNISFLSINDLLQKELNRGGILEGKFIFGSDIGGNYYFYDVNNESGVGEFSVFLVYPGNPMWKASIYLGNNLTDVLQKIINGEDFMEYKRGI